MSNYIDGWRSGDAGGGVRWADDWNSGAYAQQIKSAAKVDNEYLDRFNSLGKSNSSVDDEAGWRTVTSLRNNNSGNVQSIQQQAEEWKNKGFDVRVQDLDESHGAKWADLAVRKGPGMDEPVAIADHSPAPPKPYEDIPGVDSYVPRKRSEDTGSDREQARDRINNYADFNANDWIAEKSRPEEDVKLAQNIADKYKFEIRKNLKPTAESIVNALDTAIPT